MVKLKKHPNIKERKLLNVYGVFIKYTSQNYLYTVQLPFILKQYTTKLFVYSYTIVTSVF